MRRFVTAFGLLVLAAATAFGDEPKAVIAGPAQAVVAQDVLVSLAGSSSDVPVIFEQVLGPARATVGWIYQGAGPVNVPNYATVQLPTPGRYIFVLIAQGKPSNVLLTRRAVRGYVIDAVAAQPPTPTPNPTPTPTPTPPVPNPTPPDTPPSQAVVPMATKLYAVCIYDPESVDDNSRAVAAIVSDPGTRTQLRALNVDWYAWDRKAPVVASLGFGRYADVVGGPPVLIVYDAARNVYDAAGAVMTRPAGFRPQLTQEAMVSYFKALRGLH